MRRWAVYRKHVLIELLESEKLYVNDLKVLTNIIDKTK
jgi:hypothetical protein